MSDTPDALLASIRELEERIAKFVVSTGRLVPDLVLLSYILDVQEHAEAVVLIADSPRPRAAVANVRAAMESALEAKFLTSEQGSYLDWGSLARVHEILERVALEKSHARVPGLPTPSEPVTDEEAIVAEEAKGWEELAPGRGVLLQRALCELRRSGRGGRAHWSGKEKEEIYALALGPDEAGNPQGPMARVLYSMLSMEAHPRPRTGNRRLSIDERMALRIEASPDDAARMIQGAVLACAIATSALEARAAFGDDG